MKGRLMYVCVAGDPIEGFSIYGPFKSERDANDWAESELEDDTYWAVKLEDP